jgi:Fe-S-cluster containining protein
VQRLNQSIEPRINCTDCGNCCRSLLINVTAPEADSLAGHLNLSRASFDALYLEKGFSGNMLINAIPCHFLEENQCSIYAHRFSGCREFPAMHVPGFQQRMFTTMMHYARCPIIFNIVEQLKDTMGFARDLAILPEE